MKDDMPKEIWVSKRQLDKDTFLLSFEDYLTSGAVRYTRATLDRVIEGDGWLPIESAPRDGMYVLLYSPLAADNGRPDCTYMVDKWQKNLSVDGFRTCNPFHWPYTHWRPLPTPPEAE